MLRKYKDPNFVNNAIDVGLVRSDHELKGRKSAKRLLATGAPLSGRRRRVKDLVGSLEEAPQ